MPLRDDGSGRPARPRDERCDRAHAQRAGARGGREDVSRLSGRLERRQAGAGVHRTDVCVLHGHVALRLRERVARARETRRRHPRPCRFVRQRSLSLHERRGASWLSLARHGVRRHVLPDRERHGRQADCDQRRGRRGSDLRRRRRAEPVQRDGRELQLLRRPHDSKHERRIPHGHQGHRRLERLHAQTLEDLQRRTRRAGRLVGLEELLHRRQLVCRPPRSRQDDELDRRHLGEVPRLSRTPHVGIRHQGLRPGPRRRPQLSCALARCHRCRDVRES